jgi:hypothetical protein
MDIVTVQKLMGHASVNRLILTLPAYSKYQWNAGNPDECESEGR